MSSKTLVDSNNCKNRGLNRQRALQLKVVHDCTWPLFRGETSLNFSSSNFRRLAQAEHEPELLSSSPVNVWWVQDNLVIFSFPVSNGLASLAKKLGRDGKKGPCQKSLWFIYGEPNFQARALGLKPWLSSAQIDFQLLPPPLQKKYNSFLGGGGVGSAEVWLAKEICCYCLF